jgi:hypothetical protein
MDRASQFGYFDFYKTIDTNVSHQLHSGGLVLSAGLAIGNIASAEADASAIGDGAWTDTHTVTTSQPVVYSPSPEAALATQPQSFGFVASHSDSASATNSSLSWLLLFAPDDGGMKL